MRVPVDVEIANDSGLARAAVVAEVIDHHGGLAIIEVGGVVGQGGRDLLQVAQRDRDVRLAAPRAAPATPVPAAT